MKYPWIRNGISTVTQLFRCLRQEKGMWKKRKEDVGDDEIGFSEKELLGQKNNFRIEAFERKE